VIYDQVAMQVFVPSFSFILNFHTLFKIYLIKEKSVSDNIKKSQQNLMLFCSG